MRKIKMSNSTVKVENGTIIVERIFDAPRELVWKAWTDPQHFMQWWGPQGFTSPLAKIDLTVGGKYHLGMTSPDGRTMYNMGTYTEITPPERLVFTQGMADEEGNAVSPASFGMENMPDETEVIVTLEDIDGKTKLTLQQIGFPESEMTQHAGGGWAQAFEKLAATLS
jgi:uncharacterized protein YndB with AHSA1/START domain